MYGQQPSHNRLPYNPQQFAHPMLQITDPNRPAFVPPYQAEPAFMPFAPYIAGLLQMEIQGRAHENALRTNAFNFFAANGFNNQDFYELFAAVFDYVVMNVQQRRYAHPEEAIAQLLTELVDMAVAVFVQEYPELERFISPEQLYSVRDTIQLQQRMRAARQHYRQQYPVFGYGTAANLPPPNRPYSPQGGYQVPSHMAQPRSAYQQPPSTYQPGGQRSPATLSRFDLDAQQKQAGSHGAGGRYDLGNTRNIASRGSKYAAMGQDVTDVEVSTDKEPENLAQVAATALQQPFTPRTYQPNTMTTDQQTGDFSDSQLPFEGDGTVMIPEASSTYTWRPNTKQAYRPAYRPSNQARFHRVYPDGTVVVEVKPISQTDMDFEKHNLPNVFGAKREGVDYNAERAAQKFAEGAHEVAERFNWTTQAEKLDAEDTSDKAKEIREQAAKEPVHVVVKENWVADLSEAGIMLMAGVDALAHNVKGEPADVYRVNAFLAEPVLCLNDQSDFVRRVSESRSYLELAEKLSGAAAEADVALVEAITRRAIVMLNRVLTLHLSIPKVEVQLENDFDTPTIQELETILAANYGPMVVAAYKAKQREHIASIFVHDDGPAVQDLRNNVIDVDKFPEGKKPFPVFLTSKMTFTLLNMYAHDLDINFDGDTGGLLTQENAGDFYEVVKGLFQRAKSDNDNGAKFYRNLFQTRDGVLMEVVEGDLQEGAYLISRTPAAWIG